MGYRQMKDNPNVWGKPVGYHLFIYNVETNEFYNLIKGKKSILNWCTSSFNEEKEEYDDFLSWLKRIECYTKTDYDDLGISSFEFLDTVEILENIL